jgi:hypothetical protein
MPKENIRGILAHPKRNNTVKNPPQQVNRLGHDGFTKRNPRRKAKVI